MPKDASELVVASNGSVHVAPVGTTLPDDPTEALAGAFAELGFVTEDGVTLTVTPEITDYRAWQARSPVRRELTAQELMIGFALEQWNGETIPLAFGGGAITEPSPGVFRYDFPTDTDSLDERSLVVDWQDGDRNYRAVFERGNVTEAVETNLVRSALAVLPIGFKALEPAAGGAVAYVLSDDPAFGTS
jgi:hypothetical protein